MLQVPVFNLLMRLMANPFNTFACSRLLAALLLVSSVVVTPVKSAETNPNWDLATIDGRQYVSLDSLKTAYKFTKMERAGKSVVLQNAKVSVKLTVGGNECLMNGVKFVLSHDIETSNGKSYVSQIDLAKLIDPVLRPNYIQNAGDFRTVILDPGHGGSDSGASNSIGYEAFYNLKVAGLVKSQLEAKGFKVIMTRTSNTFISLQERVDIANVVKDESVFVSIHFNSGNSAARGIETFTLSPPSVPHYGSGLKESDFTTRNGNEHDSANIALATSLHGSMLRRLGKNTFDRGIKRARFSVLSGVRHPAVLFEGGFLSHPYEARLIANEQYQAAVAGGIVDSIAKYRFAVARVKNGPKN
jgi:N-acetylmuramoyl-L-alanine amidase